jgi:uncharacterized protein YlzI (FlbEa/FlbD family)
MDDPDKVSHVRVGNDIVTGYPVEICPGENIKILADKGKVFIAAPVINQTRLKQGPFFLYGEYIEVEAGPNIQITSAHPNKLIIGADISKETLRIISLEQRVENLEKALVGLKRKT